MEETEEADDGSDDPGAWRLSGNIPSEFYDSTGKLRISSSISHASKFNGYTIEQGIDVSYYQGDIDWTKVKKAGIEFAIIRIGYRGYGSAGTLVPDSYAKENLQEASAAGIPVGIYMFSQATTVAEAKEEANYAIKLLESYGVDIDLPIVMDFEYASDSNGSTGRLYNANLSKAAATKICNAFCAVVENNGYDAMVYANKSMLTNSLNASSISSSYDIWLAHYTSSTDYSGDYSYWQYSSSGSVNGISGNVDMNYRYIPPKLQTTAQTSSSISLSWSSVSGATKYQVERKNSDGSWTVLGTTTSTTYTDKSLSAATQYTYRVGSYDSSGSITYTSSINAATKMSGTTTLKGTASSYNKIKLSWSKVSGASGYKIQRYNSSTKKYTTIKTITSGSTTSYTDTGLTVGTTYKYRIRAYKTLTNTTSYSSYSNTVSATTSKAYGSVTSSTVNVRSGAGTSYKVLKTVKKSTLLTITGKSGSWYKTSITVSGKTKTGYISSSYVKLYAVPGKTTLSKNSSSYCSVKLSWSKVSSASGYQIQRYNSSTKKYTTIKTITSGSTTSYTNSNLNSSTTYKYRIRAYRTISGKKAYGSWSSVLSAKTSGSVTGKVTTSSLKVRKGAGTSYATLTTLKKGKTVTITGSRSGWYRISIKISGKTKTGYVSKSYVKLD